MRLHFPGELHTMTTDDHLPLVQRAWEAHAAFYALGHETWRDGPATYVRNRDVPQSRDGNHVRDITCTSDAELRAVCTKADEYFDGISHRMFAIGPTTPPDVAAYFALQDYARDEGLLLCLEGELRATPPSCDIRLVESAEHWAEFERLQALNAREDAKKAGEPYSAEATHQYVTVVRARASEMRMWMAYVDGVPCAFFSSWPGHNGVGYLEDLFTHPDHRHRGIATALIAHALADARERGAGPCLIPCAIEDTPKHMYAAMGFRPLLVTRVYFKPASTSSADS